MKDLLKAEIHTMKSIQIPCPVCGKEAAQDCGFGEFDHEGEFDCTHPDAENLECPCIHTACPECKRRSHV